MGAVYITGLFPSEAFRVVDNHRRGVKQAAKRRALDRKILVNRASAVVFAQGKPLSKRRVWEALRPPRIMSERQVGEILNQLQASNKNTSTPP
jgi:hypothetical protein